MAHVNVFETKTTNELIVLYREYLDAEKVSGISDTNELGKIKKMYDKEMDEYEKGTHDDLLALVTELKEILG